MALRNEKAEIEAHVMNIIQGESCDATASSARKYVSCGNRQRTALPMYVL